MAFYGMTNPMDYKYSMSIVPNPIINFSLLKKELQRNSKDILDYWDKKDIDLIMAFCRQQDRGLCSDDIWLIEVKYHSDDKTLCDERGNCDGHPFPKYIPLWMVSGKKQGSEVLFELSSDPDIAVRVICDQTKGYGFNPAKYGMKVDYEEYDPAWESDPFQQEVMNAIFRRINGSGFYNIDMKEVNDEFLEQQKEEHRRMVELFKSIGTVSESED